MPHTWLFARQAALPVLALLALLIAGQPGRADPKESGDLAVGFLYVGAKDDAGYSQAPARGAAAVKKLAGVKVLEAEKLPETDEAQRVMGRMIDEDGARVIFGCAFGYWNPHMFEAARKYPGVQFVHCAGLWKKGDPDNLCSCVAYTDECRYVSGVVAGHMSKTGKLGFVAAKPIPSVQRDINAFCLGARSANPRAEVQVIYTRDWSDPVREAEATRSLIERGCDVLTCHVDSPKAIIEAAEKAGKYTCGYHTDQSGLAPRGYLTGAEWNWERVYAEIVNKVKKKEKVGNTLRGGLKAGMVKMSPYGKAVTAAARKDADAAKAHFLEGSLVVFKGPLKSNDGKVVIAEGVKYALDDAELEKMDYEVEGVTRVK